MSNKSEPRIMVLRVATMAAGSGRVDVVAPQGYRIISGGLRADAGQDLSAVTINGFGPFDASPDTPTQFDTFCVWYTASATSQGKVWALCERSDEPDTRFRGGEYITS